MDPLLNRKGKGDLAELKVATDLLQRGYKIAFPYGEDWDFDLILSRGSELERVQVKYARAKAGVIEVRCGSHSVTNGKVRTTKQYTAATIDWIAVYETHLGRRGLMARDRRSRSGWRWSCWCSRSAVCCVIG